MGKKILPKTTTINYVCGYSSYLDFWAFNKNKVYRRYRPRLDLNKIYNLKQREKKATFWKELIELWFKKGYYFEDFTERKALKLFNKSKKKTKKGSKNAKKDLLLTDALDKGLEFYCHNKSHNTIRGITNSVKLFLEWLKQKNLEDVTIRNIKSLHAREYLDYLDFEKKVAWRTWNNKKRDLRIVFEELKKRKYIKKNPFSTKKFPNKKGEGLEHEVLPLDEAKIIISFLYEHDKYLFYYILIEFFGFARPSEIRERLRKYHFHLDKRMIEVPGVKLTKTRKTKWLTIPSEFYSFFLEDWFNKIPNHYYIFGEGNKPNTTPAGEHSIYNRYRRLIKKMHKKGLISKPYTQLYDWKRRGMTEYLKRLLPTIVRDQAGHTKLESTLVYYHPEPFSPEIERAKTSLL